MNTYDSEQTKLEFQEIRRMARVFIECVKKERSWWKKLLGIEEVFFVCDRCFKIDTKCECDDSNHIKIGCGWSPR